MFQASIYVDFGAISQIQFGKFTGVQKGSLVLKIALYKAGACGVVVIENFCRETSWILLVQVMVLGDKTNALLNDTAFSLTVTMIHVASLASFFK